MHDAVATRAVRRRRALVRALKQPLASAWGWPLVTRLLPQTAIVLAYHRVAPRGASFPALDVESFRTQIAWIRRECAPIGPGQLRDAVARPAGGRVPVLVTFDDGYLDYVEHAYPVLKAFDVEAVNFLPTRFIDEGGVFWWDAVHEAGRRTALTDVRLPWSSEILHLDAAGRARLVRECKDHLKLLMDEEKNARLHEIFGLLRVDAAAIEAERQVMTWDQARATSDLTTYGGHLHTHPLASRVDAVRLEQEIRTCRDRIAAELGRAPTLFAYPDGDVAEAAKPLLRRYGFDTAFGILDGLARAGVDWLAVPRFTGPQTVGELAWRVARVAGRAR
jgi:peptidoglycan/xylan/chitin deacetylase (PgdA/CDA1 family)